MEADDRHAQAITFQRDGGELDLGIVNVHSVDRRIVYVACCAQCRRFTKDLSSSSRFTTYLVAFAGVLMIPGLLTAFFNSTIGPVWRVSAVLVPLALLVTGITLIVRDRRERREMLAGEEFRSVYEYPPVLELMQQGWRPRPHSTTL